MVMAIRGRRKRARVVRRARVVMVACWVMAAMGLTGATAGRRVGSATEVMVVRAWRARRVVRAAVVGRVGCSSVMVATAARVARRPTPMVMAARVVQVGIPGCWGGAKVVPVVPVVLAVRPGWVVMVVAAAVWVLFRPLAMAEPVVWAVPAARAAVPVVMAAMRGSCSASVRLVVPVEQAAVAPVVSVVTAVWGVGTGTAGMAGRAAPVRPAVRVEMGVWVVCSLGRVAPVVPVVMPPMRLVMVAGVATAATVV